MVTRYRGDTYSMSWDLTINSVVADITGYTGIAFTYNRPDGSQTIINGSITDAVNGKITFDVLSTDFDLVGTFDYDIKALDAAGKIRTFDKDKLVIENDINKA